LKNEGHQGPLNRVWFFPVFYLFEERSALQRAISEVVFSGGWKNWVYYPIFVSYWGDLMTPRLSHSTGFLTSIVI
ncbi:MAG: hypothetical protein Q7U51_02175, partial [Methanoregula sp.]|nr:hypothetical protein [Methanoregula sp.]